MAQHINIEIKARSNAIEAVREILHQHQADFKGVDHQIDTYFRTENGRLKLREGNIENSLIFYKRNNQAGPKQSDVFLYRCEPNSGLRELLTESNGVLAVVDKHREIYFIENVKFHLDTVAGLGTFVEIEAIDFTGEIGVATLNEQCARYLKLFAIQEQDLLSESYSDMILAGK